jgi:DNA replication protein DnaC
MSGPAPVKARVDLDATRHCLDQLGLSYAKESLPELLNEAVKENVPTHRFLDKLLTVELTQREERRIKTSLRLSGLPLGQTLGNFDWNFQIGIERSRIETLATCEWIREHATVLISGPPGVGKTHLAVALGVKAVENGFLVAFYRLEDLLHAMRSASSR